MIRGLAAQGRRRRAEILSAQRRMFFHPRHQGEHSPLGGGNSSSSSSSSNGTSTSFSTPLHYRSYSSSCRSCLSMVPPESSSSLSNDENDGVSFDLEQDIERFAASCLDQIVVPGDLFAPSPFPPNNDTHSRSHDQSTFPSLNQELGLDSIWEDAEENDATSDDFDFVVEEQYGEPSQTGEMVGANAQIDRKEKTFDSAMQILRNFDPQDPPSTDKPEDLQLWLECAAQREAVMKYQKIIEKARDRKAFDSLGLIQRHVVQWYEDLRDAIDVRQKRYISNGKNQGTAGKRYGPFLCSLPPEKIAVIAAHEAILECLLGTGRTGLEGIPLTKMAMAIGSAIETEVITQRRMKELYKRDHENADLEDEDDDEEDNMPDKESSGSDDGHAEKQTADGEPKDTFSIIDKWTFSAGHLKRFTDDLKRIDPKLNTNKRAINYAVRKAKQAMNSEETWSKDDILHTGAGVLSILIQHTTVHDNGKEVPAFTVEKSWKDNRSTSYIVLNDRLVKIFTEDTSNSLAAITTRHTPMIIPPNDWVGPRDGGYRWLKCDFMRTHGSQVQREALKHADLSTVFDGLNVLGKTAWKINPEILEVAKHCWENDIAIGDIPTRTDLAVPPEPIRPEYIAPEHLGGPESPKMQAYVKENQKFRESLFKFRRIKQKNMDLRSLRCSAMLKLDQAEKFKDFDRIYFPYNLDFRGRAYPVPPHLSNVGSDLCRGMLTFADSKPLGERGLFWLKVHLANFAGKDKMSFEDRAKYVEENLHNIRASVENPYEEGSWWMTLDDPFQGLATCFELVRALDSGDPEAYESNLCVHMDGSCNGLQHYAALGRDTVGGKAVNLLQDEGPQDVYLGVMDEVIRRVAEESERILSFDTSKTDSLSAQQKKELKYHEAAKLVNGLIDRGVVKRTVMTSVYGVTYVGARTQIQEKIEEKVRSH